jgi:hypothetical protein
MGELTVIRWRDIPMQVIGKGAGGGARTLLPERFQEAVDAAAMVAGLIGSDDYTAQMQRDRSPCGDDIEAEVDAQIKRLEAEWPDSLLRAVIRTGGVRAEGMKAEAEPKDAGPAETG